MDKTWTVIKFTADNLVEAVPTPWNLGTRCHWTLFTHQKIISAIKKYELQIPTCQNF